MCPDGAPGEMHPGGVFLKRSGVHPGAPGCTLERSRNTSPGCTSTGASAGHINVHPGAPGCTFMCPAEAPVEVHPGEVFLERSRVHPGAPGCTPERFKNTPPGCISPGAPSGHMNILAVIPARGGSKRIKNKKSSFWCNR